MSRAITLLREVAARHPFEILPMQAGIIAEAFKYLDAVEAAHAAAVAYIAASPCDPDIFPEQEMRWDEYQAAQKRLKDLAAPLPPTGAGT